ncbi:MAG: hypothetical protein AAGG02_14915 [Cyanobacteria bacterium P01_H01_bin.15]
MDRVFQVISNKITSDVPELRWVDFDLGQLEQEQPPVSWPCALISFQAPQFQNLSRLAQQAELLIAVRLAFRVFERTHSVAQDQFRQIGLQHFSTIKKVHAALHGMDGENFKGLARASFATEPRADLRVYNLIYSCLFTDEASSQYRSWTDVAPTENPDFCINTKIS